MYAKVRSAAVLGVDAYVVEVEVDLQFKLPAFSVVGLPDNAIKESRERITSAIKNSGYPFPQSKITANLAPADIKKVGSAFDLPMAVAILLASNAIAAGNVERYMIVGELGLDGTVSPARGVLAMAMTAKNEHFDAIIVPTENAREAAVVGIDVFPVRKLNDVVDILEGDSQIAPFRLGSREIFEITARTEALDFSDVRGQEQVKRALEIAAAGGHNVLMIGPPGSGKTMLARRIVSILPPMTLEEAVETTKIHSIAGILPINAALVGARPFRAPHHTISDAGLIGGGAYPRPGEVSLAHNGVLFLDEFPEFRRNVLEVLRQPLEDGIVTISRAILALTFPAKFMLVAAMNPCQCGYYGDPYHTCTCTPTQVKQYRSKISGPILDRIDMQIEVPSVPYKKLAKDPPGESSEKLRTRVIEARHRQTARFKSLAGIYANSHMTSKLVRLHCTLSPECEEIMRMAMTRLALSARAFDRVLKLARTIADLDASDNLQPHHVAEAIQYQTLDREFTSSSALLNS